MAPRISPPLPNFHPPQRPTTDTIRDNLNPEDLATQSVRLKEEQLRREEGRLKEIEVPTAFSVAVTNARAVESAEGDFGSQTGTPRQRRSTQIPRSPSRHVPNHKCLGFPRRLTCTWKSVSPFGWPLLTTLVIVASRLQKERIWIVLSSLIFTLIFPYPFYFVLSRFLLFFPIFLQVTYFSCCDRQEGYGGCVSEGKLACRILSSSILSSPNLLVPCFMCKESFRINRPL